MKHLPDTIFSAGLILIATGIWQIYPPAAMIFAGLGLCVIGWHIST